MMATMAATLGVCQATSLKQSQRCRANPSRRAWSTLLTERNCRKVVREMVLGDRP